MANKCLYEAPIVTQIWAIADLHLCISCPQKTMEVFGHQWDNYIDRIKENWIKCIDKDDIVLLAGDITWALKLEEAKIDLEWIDELPGTKIMVRGNHDYWWKSMKQIKRILPKSIHLIQNNAINLDIASIGGSRLWDTQEFNCLDIIDYKENPLANPKVKPLTLEENERIFSKELHRLELSLSQIDPGAKLKIAMTHYPPISHDLKPSKAHELLKKYNIDICIFGHIHNLKADPPTLFGEKDNIKYIFTAADHLKFVPLKLFPKD